MNPDGLTSWLAKAAGAVLAMFVAATNALAQDSFYKGKLVTVYIGEVTGGALDAYARVLAAGLNRHLPGNPTVIVQSMPGAATVVSMNYLARRAPRDGTTLLMALSTAPFAAMYGIEAATYKATDFTWIGNFDQGTDTCTVWKGSGIDSFDDLLKKPAIFGAVAPSGIASEYPRSMNALLGTSIKVIHGYGGTAGIMLAMQRGEVQGSCAFMMSALNSSFKTDYNAGRLVPIIQFARKSDEIKSVPYMLDLAKSEEEKQLFKLLYTRDVIGRLIAAPPELPAERTAVLRTAFDEIVKDPEMIALLDKAGLPLAPMSGQEVEAFVKQYVTVPPEVLTRARTILDEGGVGSIPKK
jgi:tripartite-type tricarboxylate transporter receptor subunit TctC